MNPANQDVELDGIRTQVLEMFARTQTMVSSALRALVRRDPALARQVIASDSPVDELEVEIDRRCVDYLASNRADGDGLRFATTVMKMVIDLERIGDLAVNMAERTLEIGGGAGLLPGEEMVAMGQQVVAMIHVAGDSFLHGDPQAMQDLQRRDRVVDALNRDSFERWLTAMSEHSDQVERALAYTSVSRYLERIADHAVSLGALQVLMVEGRDVRHAPPVH